VEEGTPTELLAAGGRFAALAALESAGWDWQDDGVRYAAGPASPDG
jgi:hypothetical protein